MCTPDQRRDLMESALFLDQQMREIRDSGKVSSIDKIAVMVALNLAEELLKLRQQTSSVAKRSISGCVIWPISLIEACRGLDWVKALSAVFASRNVICLVPTY
jgi:cell division protein ZapA (FtsZ GTPase activity inhibitor)